MEQVSDNSNIISLDTGFKSSDNFVAFKEGIIDGVPICCITVLVTGLIF